MATNFNHAEEIKKKNGRVFGGIAGSITAIVATWGVWEIVWRFFGPWPFIGKGKFDAIHGTAIYLVHFVYAGYAGDLGLTWAEIQNQLSRQGHLDSFLLTIWLPAGIGGAVLLLSWSLFYRLIAGTGRQAGYIRGSRVQGRVR